MTAIITLPAMGPIAEGTVSVEPAGWGGECPHRMTRGIGAQGIWWSMEREGLFEVARR